MTLTSVNSPNSATNSRPTCCDTLSSRSAPISGPPWCRPVPERHHRTARALQEHCACLPRACNCIGAPKVTEHRMGTGTTSPLGITRCTLSIQVGMSCTLGERLGQVVEPGLEHGGVVLVAAGAFGKDHQRVAVAQRVHQRLQWVFVVGALAAHVHRVEDLARDPVLERRRRPVVAGCDRPRHCAQLARQATPRSAPSRSGSGGWQSRCAARPWAGSPANGLVRP